MTRWYLRVFSPSKKVFPRWYGEHAIGDISMANWETLTLASRASRPVFVQSFTAPIDSYVHSVETALIPLRGFDGDMMGFHGELIWFRRLGICSCSERTLFVRGEWWYVGWAVWDAMWGLAIMPLIAFLILFVVIVSWNCLYNDLHHIYNPALLMWL